ncbi:acyltransferase family protein [Isoptericola sp. b441]|uniref:Acyltransferase family protein n=1 Tax=Actinotalea lenta TaxID=3064654 RepID=A0ABT9DBT1_9CELL|nr:acyltransferase family protein [Isoptericola sp. b441]MDO8106407.1 acyltransferase family protein [Isoptericola sp. b441]
MTRADPHAGLRADIQGLRALAVGSVLAYHLWPAEVSGGYVGVDVFLVISGYLITAHLLRDQPRSWRAVGRFWGRRIRRLLPASALVVTMSSIGAALLLPSSQLARAGAEAVASALYVQNWSLAASATDYLASEGAATALRHFWSLSVEEQFYLVWPVLIGLAAIVGWGVHRATAGERSRLLPRVPTVEVVVLAVLLGSLAWSVHLTAVDPAAAYYVTTTRMWELALGGGVALLGTRAPLLRVPHRARGSLALVGLAAIAAAVLTFSGSTPFPGAAALLPTLGTAAVIVANAGGGSVAGRLLGLRGAQFLGDVSYSTYLWHWPLVVLVPFAVHRELTWWELGGIALAAVGLAWLTKVWVEDPVRRSPRLIRSARATALVLVLCTGLGVTAGLALQAYARHQESAAATRTARELAAHPDCFGAAAELSGADCSAFAHQLWTAPVSAAADKPRLYQDHCWNNEPYTTRRTCTYGPADATVTVALVGNSHAGHWFPPLEQVARAKGWRITTYVSSVCYPVDRPLSFADPAATTGCEDWNAWVRKQVTAGGYDLVVMSSRTDQLLAGVARGAQDDVAQQAYARTIGAFTSAGSQVLVLRDTPNFPSSVPDCVAASPAQDCTTPRDVGLEPDPLAAAARADTSGKVSVLDVTDLLCDGQVCHGVIGSAIVYFDHGHMTATFARTLRPVVEPALTAALAGAG